MLPTFNLLGNKPSQLLPPPPPHHSRPHEKPLQVQYNPYLCRSLQPPIKSNIMAIDKSITLKKGLTRYHIHRYDLRLKVKQAKTEEDEVSLIQQALQRFLDIMLQADPSTTIAPFFELDQNDKSVPDLTSKFKVSDLDSLPLIKRYFSRLSNWNDQGNVYCSVILAENITFYDIMDKAQQVLLNLENGLFPKASDHEDTAEVGWLLCSTRQQDEERNPDFISNIVKEKVGAKIETHQHQ